MRLLGLGPLVSGGYGIRAGVPPAANPEPPRLSRHPADQARVASARRAPLLVLLAVGMTFVGLLGGCGSSDNGVASKSGKAILEAAKQAAQNASSVHVVSSIKVGRLSLSGDLELGKEEGRAHLNVLGNDFEVIRVASTLYAKGSAEFYRGLLSTARVPNRTWLKSSSSTTKLGQIAHFTELRRQLDRMLSTPGSVTKGPSTTIDGQKVIELKEATKVYKGSLYIATTGKPYPLLLVKNGGRERGRTTFSGWDKRLLVGAPSPSVDISVFED
jgi:hypothetical protein